MEHIYESIEIPQEQKATSITEKEAKFIYDFLKKNKITKTLEIGFAYGCSTAHIISATKAKHYAVDPFQKNYSNLGLRNIQKLKLDKFLVFENDFSHNILPQLLTQGIRANFAFIDGGHKFDDIFVDFYFVDLLLNKNGYVLFHDSWMRSTQHVVSWIKNNKMNYRFLKTPIRNLILVQKIGDDYRKWYHYKGFCTFKSFFSHLLFKILHKEK